MTKEMTENRSVWHMTKKAGPFLDGEGLRVRDNDACPFARECPAVANATSWHNRIKSQKQCRVI